MKEEDRDWASIPGDLLRTIAERVGSLEHYARFGAVCQSWHSSTTCSLNNNSKSIFFPWLMLPEKEDSDMRGFYSISSGKIFEIELPEIRGKKCWGSPFGWLITYGLDLDIHLFNPLSRTCLPLPSHRTFTNQYRESLSPKFLRNLFIYKILLSKSPDFIAMAIYTGSRKLAFAKPGDDTWRPIQCVEARFHDIIYFDGNFFTVDNFGNVLICEDLYGHNPVAVEFAAPPPVKDRFKKYLVDLGGDLCLVCRNIVCLIPYDTEGVKELYKTDCFEIFKLDMLTRKWEQVLSLGDWCLFLGSNYSFSIRASDYPGWCRSNCIYFTDDFWQCLNVSSDMGIFDYENKKVYPFPESAHMDSLFSRSLWIAPCLQ